MTLAGLALGASRTAGYVAVALVLGGVGFVVFAWGPARRAVGDVGPAAAAAFERRAARFTLCGCGLGVAGAAGILIAGHRAPASTAWLVVELLCWLAIGSLVRLRGRRGEGAAGAGGPLVALIGLATLALVLAGEPSSVLVGGLSTVHVLGAGIWVGGVVYLAAVLPAALARVGGEAHVDLLLATLARFSPPALASVIAIVVTGAAHTAVVLPDLSALWDTAFGRLIIAKVLLVGILVGIGALQRYRVMPALAAPGRRRREPRRAAILARRALAIEVVAMAVVLVATAALVAAAPSPRSPAPYSYAHVDSRRSAPEGADGDRGG